MIFHNPIGKEVTRIEEKMKKKLQKTYFADYNFLIAQYLGQVYCQILLETLLKEFIKSNVYMDVINNKCEMCGIK